MSNSSNPNESLIMLGSELAKPSAQMPGSSRMQPIPINSAVRQPSRFRGGGGKSSDRSSVMQLSPILHPEYPRHVIPTIGTAAAAVSSPTRLDRQDDDRHPGDAHAQELPDHLPVSGIPQDLRVVEDEENGADARQQHGHAEQDQQHDDAAVVAGPRRAWWGRRARRGGRNAGHGDLRRQVATSHHSMTPKIAKPTNDGTTNHWTYSQGFEAIGPWNRAPLIPYTEHSPGGTPISTNSTVTRILLAFEALTRLLPP